MTPLQWRMHIIDRLADIGSADYQAQAWFGKGEKISSFAEIYATLMDDFILPDFSLNQNQARSAISNVCSEVIYPCAGRICRVGAGRCGFPDHFF